MIIIHSWDIIQKSSIIFKNFVPGVVRYTSKCDIEEFRTGKVFKMIVFVLHLAVRKSKSRNFEPLSMQTGMNIR